MRWAVSPVACTPINCLLIGPGGQTSLQSHSVCQEFPFVGICLEKLPVAGYLILLRGGVWEWGQGEWRQTRDTGARNPQECHHTHRAHCWLYLTISPSLWYRHHMTNECLTESKDLGFFCRGCEFILGTHQVGSKNKMLNSLRANARGGSALIYMYIPIDDGVHTAQCACAAVSCPCSSQYPCYQ